MEAFGIFASGNFSLNELKIHVPWKLMAGTRGVVSGLRTGNSVLTRLSVSEEIFALFASCLWL